MAPLPRRNTARSAAPTAAWARFKMFSPRRCRARAAETPKVRNSKMAVARAVIEGTAEASAGERGRRLLDGDPGPALLPQLTSVPAPVSNSCPARGN